MDALLSDQELVKNTVETGLNKSIPTDNNESNNISAKGDGVGNTEKINDDANVNKSIHRK